MSLFHYFYTTTFTNVGQHESCLTSQNYGQALRINLQVHNFSCKITLTRSGFIFDSCYLAQNTPTFEGVVPFSVTQNKV